MNYSQYHHLSGAMLYINAMYLAQKSGFDQSVPAESATEQTSHNISKIDQFANSIVSDEVGQNEVPCLHLHSSPSSL